MEGRDRWEQIAKVATFGLGPVGMNLFLPALPDIARSLDRTIAATQSTMSTYLVVFAVVMLLSGPVVDRFGRRPLALCGISCFIVGCLMGCWAPTLELLIVARCLQAIGAGLAGSASRMMVTDLNRGEALSRAIGRQTIMMMIGTTSSAAGGGWLVQWHGWRVSFVVMAALSALTLLLALAVLPETRPASLAQRSFHGIVTKSAVLVKNRVYLLSVAQLSLCSALFQVFVSTSPHTLEHVRGKESAGLFSIYLFILYAGFLAGTAVTASKKLLANTDRRRLQLGMHGQLLATLAVFLLALPVQPTIIAIFLAFAFVSFSQAIINPIMYSQAADAASRENASTATGVAAFIQLVAAGVGVQIVGYFELSTWRALGATVFAMALVGWVTQRWTRWRRHEVIPERS